MNNESFDSLFFFSPVSGRLMGDRLRTWTIVKCLTNPAERFDIAIVGAPF